MTTRRGLLLLTLAAVLMSAVGYLAAQEKQVVKMPTIESIKMTPADPIIGGTCETKMTVYSGGYLSRSGPAFHAGEHEAETLSDEEVGSFVRKALADGYKLELWPAVNGIFVAAECTAPPKKH